MDVKSKAKDFAIKAHSGQVRKSEPDKPMIVHPINVAMLLEEYGYDDNVVAAGYLHDVVEDTRYTIEDIREMFGDDIADLVNSASEPNKKLSWEERKRHTIESVKYLPSRNKALICADKISNLEDIMIRNGKTGVKDYSDFKRGEEKQKWYYTNVYKSLIYGEDLNNPLFDRFKNIINNVFGEKSDNYLKNAIFDDDLEYYERLKKLHAWKQELYKLKYLTGSSKPYVVEFAGTPRTGKTTIINNLYDFFKKGGFDVTLVPEFTTSNHFKNVVEPKLVNVNYKDKLEYILEAVYYHLMMAIESGGDIILVDRSINDRQIWNYRGFRNRSISEEDFLKMQEKYVSLSKELINSLIVTFAVPLAALRRDYNNSLALENRRFMNFENLKEYNDSLIYLLNSLKYNTDNMVYIDTTSRSLRDVSLEAAEAIVPDMRKVYVKTFKDNNGIK